MSKEVIQSVDQLKSGDHISYPCKFCISTTHHALVVADNIAADTIKIIHVAERKCRAPGEKKFEVREDAVCVSERIKEGKLRRYKYAPNQCREPFDVISLAKSMIGDFNFNGISNNCSHFARLCKAKPEPVESSGEADAGYKPKGASRDKKRYGYGDSGGKKCYGYGDSGRSTFYM